MLTGVAIIYQDEWVELFEFSNNISCTFIFTDSVDLEYFYFIALLLVVYSK